MTEDLLAKEKEFRRLNRALQERTRDLMKEVEEVIASRVNDTAPNINKDILDSTELLKMVTIKSPEQRRKIANNGAEKIAHIQGKDEELVQNKENNSSANKAIVSFLKAKIDMLNNELHTIRLEYKKKCEYCGQLEAEHKKFDEISTKLHNQIDTLRTGTGKLQNTNTDLQSHCQALQTENSSMKKDLDRLERRVKALQQESNTYEMRMNRSLEDNEKLKNCLKTSQVEEKELRSQIRKLQEENRVAIKSLEKQRSELVNAFKKQTLVIDNLKKQNAYLIAAGALQFTEDEFSRLLDRKVEDLD